MTGRWVLHGCAKVLMVLLATVAGAAAGGLLGAVFVETTMPGAGFEALGPVLGATVGGSVLGAFAALLALFKTPRVQREHAAFRGATVLVLLVIGTLGFVAMGDGGPQSPGAMLAVAALPLAALAAVTTIASLTYGPRRARPAEVG